MFIIPGGTRFVYNGLKASILADSHSVREADSSRFSLLHTGLARTRMQQSECAPVDFVGGTE